MALVNLEEQTQQELTVAIQSFLLLQLLVVAGVVEAKRPLLRLVLTEVLAAVRVVNKVRVFLEQVVLPPHQDKEIMVVKPMWDLLLAMDQVAVEVLVGLVEQEEPQAETAALDQPLQLILLAVGEEGVEVSLDLARGLEVQLTEVAQEARTE